MSVQVPGRIARSRYEARCDGELLGSAAQQKIDGLIVFTHTEVDPALAGQGIGGLLVGARWTMSGGLDLRVLPVCPFVQA